MRSRSPVLGVVIVGLLALGGATVAWAVFLRGDDVAPLALPSTAPVGSAGATAGSSTGASADPAEPGGPSLPAGSGAAVDAAGLPGTWTVGSDSVVGYRVRERLANLSADSDAVGRTSAITGTVTISGSGSALTVSAASFTVDMTTITSDRQMRDNRLRNDGIQTDQFPTATFTLTQPIALPANATSAQVDVTLHGELTLHGVTRTVDIPAKAQVNGSLIQVLGSLDFPFADFDIEAPNIGGFVSVEDHGTLEFLVTLAKA